MARAPASLASCRNAFEVAIACVGWPSRSSIPALVAISARTCLRSLRTLSVPNTSSTSCDQVIFVDQATDASLSSDAALA